MSTSMFEETPYWRPAYADGVSHLLKEIPIYFKYIKKFIKDSENKEYVRGFTDFYQYMYLTECNRGENTGTQSMESTETALSKKCSSRNDKKTLNLSEAVVYLFGDSLLVETLGHEFNAGLAKKLNQIIGDDLFEDAGCYRQTYAKPLGYDYCYLAPHHIEHHMDRLFKKVKKDLETSTNNWYEIAASFLHQFLFIHPFSNGNGRTARLLVSALLINYSIVPISLFCSAFEHSNSNRIYLRCLDESHRYKNCSLLCSLIIESAHRTLSSFVKCLDVDTEYCV